MIISKKAKICFLSTSITVSLGFPLYFLAIRPKESENCNTNTSFQAPVVDNILSESSSEMVSDQQDIKQVQQAELYEAGYITYWDYQNGVSRYENSKETFFEVLPTWYGLGKEEAIESKKELVKSLGIETVFYWRL